MHIVLIALELMMYTSRMISLPVFGMLFLPEIVNFLKKFVKVNPGKVFVLHGGGVITIVIVT